MYLDEFSVYLNDIEFKVMTTFKIKNGETQDFKIDTINALD